ncbi:MAG: fructose-bisphosphatase class III, partial [Firmicutes bacterium]|nr:fructose-bisphosphatase class III [Bacillota bacterium]
MKDMQFLRLLSEKYPNARAATSEIVNLRAILSLPKGTEYFFSDLHGEYEAFRHMIKSASGVIRSKVDEEFGRDLTRHERSELAALIYDAPSAIARQKKRDDIDYEKWCFESIYQLIQI